MPTAGQVRFRREQRQDVPGLLHHYVKALSSFGGDAAAVAAAVATASAPGAWPVGAGVQRRQPLSSFGGDAAAAAAAVAVATTSIPGGWLVQQRQPLSSFGFLMSVCMYNLGQLPLLDVAAVCALALSVYITYG
jgi:hypothetical protein